eukprot:971313_1
MFSVVLLLFGITNAVIKISDDEIYELTPFGYWSSECFHSIPSGAEVINFDEHFTVNGRSILRCRRPHNSTYINERINSYLSKTVGATGSGWQVYVKQDAGDSVTGFNGTWTVPPLPVQRSTGEVLYTFTGLQNIDWVPPEREPTKPFDIIQPVLQYGAESGRGGGAYWGVSSWYVTLGNDVLQSTLVKVSPGDSILGVMQKTSTETWFVNSIDVNTAKNTSFSIKRSILQSQPWVYVTLEVYNIGNCENEYPPKGTTIPYTKLSLTENNTPAKLNFQIGTNGQKPPVCDSKIAINDATSVTITF